MRSLTIVSLAVSAALSGSAALAQDRMATNPAGAQPIAGEAVYKAFHEKEGIQRIVDDFVPRVTSDPRIKDHFEGVDLDHLNRLLVEQLCYLAGGPCAYSGRSMAETHQGMGVNNADFNALAEDLQISMNREKVPFTAQNRLLAKLAPMQRVIVGK